ncbi:hypothetical protein CH373_03210 [Leptospira perolatii]|uniref:Uncharacterized protein n=1 Tax=Leptospira perolatii TaxID=2023191 RepID=A0A2M9ZSP5_9LEPT|nr:hypothetical protein [Leptospira perolatii]PJZ71511.1 hypothetical protein CH360_03205 [Leptospira perolatii]PJZ75044.1 hypothetical protein CH373_03210 [Leptospira perolatii]
MVVKGKGIRSIASVLALSTLAFFLHSSFYSPYPGKKSQPKQIITGIETEYQEDSNLAEASESTELLFQFLSLEKILRPGFVGFYPSHQDRFQYQFCKLLAQYLLNIPPPSTV